jgi:hypothetical protein
MFCKSALEAATPQRVRKMANLQTNWNDFSYLLRGNNRQQEAYHALQSLAVFDILEEYSPVLVGTIPLDIDVPGSDLDIICQAQDLATIERLVVSAFGLEEDFRVKNVAIKSVSSLIANLNYGGFPIEIFGQPKPITAQDAYRHMIIEARLLNIGGEKARQAIQQIKLSGRKTEPAFARYFHLEGNPYQRLLDLAESSDGELRAMIARGRNVG